MSGVQKLNEIDSIQQRLICGNMRKQEKAKSEFFHGER